MADTLSYKKPPYDFFSLYGLSKYTADNPTYGGFLPINIKTTKLYTDESNSDVDSANPSLEFILPMSISELSDGVSVTYNRRGNNVMEGQVAQAISEWVASLRITDNSLSENIAQIILAKYDPSTLNKRLEFDFILPIVNPTGYNANFIQDVRNALGALQGITYPRSFGLCYAPMVSVTIGGLYKNFKGFISDVSFRTSQELVNIGGEMFPLVISGSVKMLNVFMYTWNEDFKNVIGSFNLKENPSLLFGFDLTNTSEVLASGTSYGSATSNKILSSEIKNIKNAASIGAENNTSDNIDSDIDTDEMPEMNEKTKENLRQILEDSEDTWNLTGYTDFESMSNNIKNMDASIIDNAGQLLSEYNGNTSLISSATNVQNLINSDSLFNINIDSLSGIASSFSKVSSIVNRTFNNINAFSTDLSNIISTGALSEIKSIYNVSKSLLSDINSVSSSMNTILNLGSNLIGNTSRTLNMNNVSYFYSNLNNFSTISNTTSNNVFENVLSNVLTAQNTVKLINSASSVISNSANTVNPITALSAISSINVISNVSSGLSSLKTSIEDSSNKASSLLASGDITTSEYYTIKQINDAAKNINIDYLTVANSSLDTKINSIIDKIL